jgi:hypothetical protein
MEEYPERSGYEELRDGRKYVIHVHREDVRRECGSEEELCSAIDWARETYPKAGLTVVQLPMTLKSDGRDWRGQP